MSVEGRSIGATVSRGPSIGRSPGFSGERGGTMTKGFSISRTGAITERSFGKTFSRPEKGVASVKTRPLITSTRPLRATGEISRDTQKFVSPFKNTEVRFQQKQQQKIVKAKTFSKNFSEYKAQGFSYPTPQIVERQHNGALYERKTRPDVKINFPQKRSSSSEQRMFRSYKVEGTLGAKNSVLKQGESFSQTPVKLERSQAGRERTQQTPWTEIQTKYTDKKLPIVTAPSSRKSTLAQIEGFKPQAKDEYKGASYGQEIKVNPFIKEQQKAVDKKGERFLKLPQTVQEFTGQTARVSNEHAKAKLEQRVQQLREAYRQRYGMENRSLSTHVSLSTEKPQQVVQDMLRKGAVTVHAVEEAQMTQRPNAISKQKNQEQILQLIHKTMQEKGLTTPTQAKPENVLHAQPDNGTKQKVEEITQKKPTLELKAQPETSLQQIQLQEQTRTMSEIQTLEQQMSEQIKTQTKTKQQNSAVVDQRVIYRPEQQDFVIEREEIVPERDPQADQSRIEAAVAVGEQALEQAQQEGKEGVTTEEVAENMPHKPNDSLVSTIRKQLDLPLHTEKQYDEFRSVLGGSQQILKSTSEIRNSAKYATDKAPAVRLNTRITTEPVKPIDEIRAVERGEEQILYLRQESQNQNAA